jgi:type II secretory pathway pseudopilin PulG
MQRGHTMSELLVTLVVAATLAGVSVPGIAWVEGRAAVKADARSLALVLRRAQARAAMSGATVSVRLEGQGRGYICEQTADSGTTVLERGEFHGPCATNYPGDAVEFRTWGWPCSLSGEPRAGSFTFASHGAEAAVVLQMGGRVRWQ